MNINAIIPADVDLAYPNIVSEKSELDPQPSVLSLLVAVAVSVAFTGCTATRHSTAAAAPNSATFQMRLVLDAPSKDSIEMSVVHQTESPVSKEVLYVQNAVLLDQTALRSAKV